MTICKNKKVMFNSPDCDADFFDIVTRILLGDTLMPYVFYNLPRLST